MTYFLILLLVLLVAAALMTMPRQWRRLRRRRISERPLAPGYDRILHHNVPLYRRMPPELREQLRGHVNVLLNEKRFIGCGGLTVTREMRVTIAGHASLLLLNRPADYFPGFRSILVYPDTYVADEISYDGDIEIHERVERVGESWHRGPVVLSWQDIVKGISGQGDGVNPVLHEFAHKLDEQNGDTEGLPELGDETHYAEWAKVLAREFVSLGEALDSGADSVLDNYALTSPAEFFAVATEVFFESPSRMREQLPELYAQFRRYYCVDPATWK